MKRFGWVLVLMMAASPAWAAKKITVQQLTDLLTSLQQSKKADAEVATELKQIELSEELTRATMNGLAQYLPGPLSTEQIYVLEARSAVLPPPAADLPSTPAPDAAGQKAILDKATDYTTKTYSQLPQLTATKTTLRFQDNVEAAPASSGLHSSATDVSTGSNFVNPFQFIHYINSTDALIASDHGTELEPKEKDKTPWGSNRMIALQTPDPSLDKVFDEARTTGDIKWQRWELVNGKLTAVFSYGVPKKKAHMDVNVCCFPDVSQAGVANFSSAALTGSGGVKGNFQTATSWHNFKASVPYHGELFIDPESGIVVRIIVVDELKQSDVVHQIDERIDYAPVTIDGKPLVVPVRTVTLTNVVPNGDSGSAGAYSERRTFFTAEYKDYKATK